MITKLAIIASLAFLVVGFCIYRLFKWWVKFELDEEDKWREEHDDLYEINKNGKVVKKKK